MKIIVDPGDPAPSHAVREVWSNLYPLANHSPRPDGIDSGEHLMKVVREMVDRVWHEAHAQGRAWQSARESVRYLVVTQEEKDAFVKRTEAEEAERKRKAAYAQEFGQRLFDRLNAKKEAGEL
jgi:hypothetical protein